MILAPVGGVAENLKSFLKKIRSRGFFGDWGLPQQANFPTLPPQGRVGKLQVGAHLPCLP